MNTLFLRRFLPYRVLLIFVPLLDGGARLSAVHTLLS